MTQTHCNISDCVRKHRSKGYCNVHYTRFRKYGDPEFRMRARGASADERLRFRGWDVTESGCWEWLGRRQSDGYGSLTFAGGDMLAHRLAYTTWVGPIPEGLLVRHKCDNRPCVNPEHLETGTNADNMADRGDRNRQARGSRSAPAVLSESDIPEIRDLYNSGLFLLREIAEWYGVGKGAIGSVVRGDTWQHV